MMADLVERDIGVQEMVTVEGTVVRRLTVDCDRYVGTTFVAVCAVCPGCVGFLLPSGGRRGAVLCRPPGDPARIDDAEASAPAAGAVRTTHGG